MQHGAGVACVARLGGLIASLLISAGSAGATSVLVPDDYPTIQQAIDSGADTVVVREGRYEEDLVATEDLVLLSDEPWAFYPSLVEVIVGGLSAARDIRARGIRFSGPVSLDGPPSNPQCRFEGCRFDGPLTAPTYDVFLYARGCIFLGDVTISPWTFEIVNCTFIGAHVDAWFHGYAEFIGNVFVGPGDFAIKLIARNGGAWITGNTIAGKVDGVVVESPSGTVVRDNEVFDCSGTAFRSQAERPYPIYFTGNRVKNCGGHGFEVIGTYPSFLDNVVDSVGGDGIRTTVNPSQWITDNQIRHTGGRGISTEHGVLRLSGNTILDTGSDGLVVQSSANADSNVIGRTGGKGLWLTESRGSRIGHNTVYSCSGDGIVVEGASTDSVVANIAYANGGAGLAVAGPGTLVLSCNDWQANTGGATVGIAPGPTDLAVDPLFCNVVEDDVSLTSASPLLNWPGCGQIGALGQGCEISISGPLGVIPSPERFRVLPQPALDRVTFTWPAGGGPARLEVFDVTGARRWQAEALAGTDEMSWNLRGVDGDRLPAGVYWARLTQNGEALHSRIVRIK